MTKTGLILLIVAIPAALTFDGDRTLEVGLTGYKACGGFVRAEVGGSPDGFDPIAIRPVYLIEARSLIRNYRSDGFGWYSYSSFVGSLGKLELAGGILGFALAAGINYSRLEGGHETTDILVGPRIDGAFRFDRERRSIEYFATWLTDGDIAAARAAVLFYPIRGASIGVGVDYDGRLDEWGEPLPWQDDWPDRWNNGINYYLSIGYRFNL